MPRWYGISRFTTGSTFAFTPASRRKGATETRGGNMKTKAATISNKNPGEGTNDPLHELRKEPRYKIPA